MSWSECCGCAMAFYAACQRQIAGTPPASVPMFNTYVALIKLK